MATEVVHIVDPDNGPGTDYTSLAAWEAAQQRNLVAADEIAVAKCRCTAGSADTAALTLSGWTTDATRYVKIWTDPSEPYRHTGKWSTGNKYRLVLTEASVEAIGIFGPQVKIHGLQISAGVNGIFVFESGMAEIAHNVIRSTYSSGGATPPRGVRCMGSSSTCYVFNNIIYDFINGTTESNAIYLLLGTGHKVYNNTVVNCGAGIRTGSNMCIAKNNLFAQIAVPANTYIGTFSVGTDYNACDNTDAIGTGTHNRTSQTFAFADAANDNYHLLASDTGARGYGIGPGADGNVPIVDIDGDARSGATCDIGADEFRFKVTLSDAGQGADALAQLAAALSLVDSVAGIDSFAAQAGLLLSDAGQGLDQAGAFNLIQVTDDGACADLVAPAAAAVSINDSGQSADVLARIAVALSLIDSVAGIDSFAGQANLALSDAGSGADAPLSPSVVLQVADSGAADDAAVFIAALLAVAEAGTGLDGVSISAQVGVQENCTGLDAAGLYILIQIAESSSGADLVTQIRALLAIAESGSALEALAGIAAVLGTGDAGVAIDTVSAYVSGETKTVYDRGAAGESIGGITVRLEIAEEGMAADSIAQLSSVLSIMDSGSGIDAAALAQRLASIGDAGIGADALTGISVSVTVSDAAKAADRMARILSSLAVADSGLGTDVATSVMFLAKGRIRITFSAKAPSVRAAAKAPSISVSGKTPTITIH